MQRQDIGRDSRAIIIPRYGIKGITSVKIKFLLETIPKRRVKSTRMFARSVCNFLSFLFIILRANFLRESFRSRIARLRDRMFVSETSSCDHPATRFQGILFSAFFHSSLLIARDSSISLAREIELLEGTKDHKMYYSSCKSKLLGKTYYTAKENYCKDIIKKCYKSILQESVIKIFND